MYGTIVQDPIRPVRSVSKRLAGLAGAPITIEMPDGTVHTYNTIDPAISTDLNSGGRPIRPGGGYYTVTLFMGGFLFDNCPLNVILGNGWISGQIEALTQAGLQPGCPQYGPATLALTTTPSTIAAPTTYAPSVPPVAGTTIQGPAYTNTVTTGGIVTQPSTIAPQTGVSAPGVTPPSITGSGGPIDMGATPAGTTSTDYTPYIILGVLAIFLMKRKG